jgi:anthranilate phosphoribosyltransferase
VIGLYDRALLEPVARALRQHGSEPVMVVHGQGLDEIAPAGETEVAEWSAGTVRSYSLSPRDFGLGDEDPADLRGGDAGENAVIARAILAGERRGGARSAVVMAAAAALHVATDQPLPEAAQTAAKVIDEGTAAALLARWVEASR